MKKLPKTKVTKQQIENCISIQTDFEHWQRFGKICEYFDTKPTDTLKKIINEAYVKLLITPKGNE